MIHGLIIGKEPDVEKYATIVSKSGFYSTMDKLFVDEGFDIQCVTADFLMFDAIFLVSPLSNLFQLFSVLIRLRCNIYFVNQPSLGPKDLERLNHLYNESGNLIFPEFREINHPVVQEFITVQSSQLLFRYNKSISGKKDILPTIFTGLNFLSVLSPMPVKKINVNSIETSVSGKPSIKIRLKMWNSSISYIILKIDHTNEHSILLESQNGNFIFNLTESYLENIHGIRFKSEQLTDEDLLLKTLETFAMSIILNKKPVFSFDHYLLSVSILSKIENILNNSI
ncbi:MAG TPA: hypothetical protein PKH79_00080 [Prolixibacteraceae bacterium]|nr:hypothetical protein [Prolixibacteraceae bacterium]HPS11624.1 hypothetical protein [Prolixibacteraceae bacterium]